MDRSDLYDKMAARKAKPKDLQPYKGDNGRVNRCVDLFKIGALKKGGKLVDVGGGIGDLAYACKDWFDRRVVVDITPLNEGACRAKGASFILDDVDKNGLLGVESGTTDVVTALDFIEHIVDPENFARECNRIMKSGGQVFINTPNIRFWRHIEELVFNGTFPHTSGDKEVFHGGHLAFYTYKDLQAIFGKAGFTGFERFKDEECYSQPEHPSIASNVLAQCKSREAYVELCLEFGCPNLLFKAVKP